MSMTPASPPGPALLDQPTLERLRELDPGGAAKLLPRVIAAFETSLERLLPELLAARAATPPNLGVIRHVAHTLKSSSASLGALQLAQTCAEIETKARNGEAAPLQALLDNMLTEIEQARAALKALLTT